MRVQILPLKKWTLYYISSHGSRIHIVRNHVKSKCFFFCPGLHLAKYPKKSQQKYKKWCFFSGSWLAFIASSRKKCWTHFNCPHHHLDHLPPLPMVILHPPHHGSPWWSLHSSWDSIKAPRQRHHASAHILPHRKWTNVPSRRTFFKRKRIWTNCFSGDMLLLGGVHFSIFNHQFPLKKQHKCQVLPNDANLGVFFVIFEKGVKSDPYFRCLKGHGWKMRLVMVGADFSSPSIYFPDN